MQRSNDNSTVSPTATTTITAVTLFTTAALSHQADLPTPFYWLFYNVDLPTRHRDRISSTLSCDPIKLDAIHISPMRKPDYFWSNIPDLERALEPFPQLDRLCLQVCGVKLSHRAIDVELQINSRFFFIMYRIAWNLIAWRV